MNSTKGISLISFAFVLLFFMACNSDPGTKHPAPHAHDGHAHAHDGHDHGKKDGHDHSGHDHGANPHAHAATDGPKMTDLIYEGEKNFKTFGGDNAEAYWSFDNSKLVFQATNEKWGAKCDQIFYMAADGSEKNPPMISTGQGRTTCSYFMPGDKTIIYASTHNKDAACPWGIFPGFDIYLADLNGKILKQFTTEEGYDAEPTVSPDGKKIVFTSTRSGDLELYTMDIDGSNIKQVTNELGYDGGAFFSPDSKQLLFRASRPKTPEEIKSYKELLKENVVQPTAMELYVCDVDGSNMKQVTDLGGANWAPYFHPSGKSIVFSTNHHSKSGRQFNIFSINVDGTGLRQVTHDNAFDAFPMFSPDGKKLAFSSNRNNGGTRDTNVFVAEWVD